MEEDLKIICSVCMVSEERIRARDRHQNVAMARHFFFYLEKKVGYDYKSIGDFIGYDRVTVLHGATKIEDYLQVNDELVWKFWKKIRTIKKMSERKQTIIIGPAPGSNNSKEQFEIDGFECPYCGGDGFHRLYMGKESGTTPCTRCGGSGKLTASVDIKWKKDTNK